MRLGAEERWYGHILCAPLGLAQPQPVSFVFQQLVSKGRGVLRGMVGEHAAPGPRLPVLLVVQTLARVNLPAHPWGKYATGTGGVPFK